MADTELDQLQTAIKRHWSRVPSQIAKLYVHAFDRWPDRDPAIDAPQ